MIAKTRSIGLRTSAGSEPLLARRRHRHFGWPGHGAASTGRFADAARNCHRDGELLNALPTRSLENLVYLAACQALFSGIAGETSSGVPSAERQPAADKAVAILRTAAAAGYANAARIRNNPSFLALRSHPDFQRLLMEMESRGITKKP